MIILFILITFSGMELGKRYAGFFISQAAFFTQLHL